MLIGVNPADLPSPLRQFQATEFSSTDFKKLIKTINSTANENRLFDQVVDKVFDRWSPDLESEVVTIIKDHAKASSNSPSKSERNLLEEILELSRLNASRTSRISAIPAGAVEDLCKSLVQAYEAAQGEVKPQLILNALQSTLKPISYLAKRIGTPDEMMSELPSYLKFRDYDFKFVSSDDDIPF